MRTREEVLARVKEIRQRGVELKAKYRLSRAEEAEIGNLGAELEGIRGEIESLDRLEAIAGAARGEGNFQLEGERHGINPYASRDADARARGGRHDGALRQLERAVKDGLPARSAEVVERLLGTGPEVERSWVARWVQDTGSSEYRSAWGKLILHGESRAALEWDAAERAAFERVSRLKNEMRAMSLTDSAGGYLAPYFVDPSIVLVSGGSQSPLLDISNVKVTTTDVWHGVTSAGVQFSWDAEATEVSDDSPTLAEPAIPNYKLNGWVPYSVELEGDAVNLVGEIGKLMSDGATQILNQALAIGSGVGAPTGIITALAGGASVINTATPATLVAGDVYALQNALPPRWQSNARWIANLATLNALRQMETSNGALKFPSLQSDSPTLLGRPVHEASFMDGTVAAGKHPLVYGDFGSNFIVTQRVGSSVELVPHVMGPNGRPTGQRGIWVWGRWGSDSINDSAFRMLQA